MRYGDNVNKVCLLPLDYHVLRGYLFKGNSLCPPRTSLREQCTRKIHESGIAVHPGRDKTLSMLAKRFYWP